MTTFLRIIFIGALIFPYVIYMDHHFDASTKDVITVAFMVIIPTVVFMML